MIKKIIEKLIPWLKGSFDTSEQGASAKKLTSFVCIFLLVWIHFKFCDKENCFEFAILDASTALTLLGVATIDKLQQRKDANDRPQDITGESK